MQLSSLTKEQVRHILANLHKLPERDQAETLEMLEELTARKKAAQAQDSLLAFAHQVSPVLQIETEPKVFMVGPHHKRLAALMDAVARGEKKRILISIAPRFGKSLLSSYLFPAWYMGKFPNRNIIMASHTENLATGFGRKVRDLISTTNYQTVFPGVDLKADSKAAGQWATGAGGQYFACGTGTHLAGRGCNLCILPTTRIITQRGVIRASEVQLGDWVYGLGGWGQVSVRVRSVSATQVRINGVSMTPNHPVWVEGGGWTEARNVVVGDRLRGLIWVARLKIVYARIAVWLFGRRGT